MRLKTLMVINAVVATVFGIAFVILPKQIMSLYGVEVTPILQFVGQLFGAELCLIAVLTWSARNATDSEATKAIVLALFVGDIIAFVVALIGQLGQVVNGLGWSTVAIYLLLGIGFGYFQFKQPAVQVTESLAD